ncbi:flavodoxin family protein [Oscillospiraceae bacterium MB08-C2-2]|nr:flavodoxin family protein [Oscillospiraceae bacterium MB08-C2-2]
MKIILHDLNQQEFTAWQLNKDADTIIISDNGTIRHCIGCFGCWIKTPGVCVLKDGYSNMGELLSQCDELIIISQCVYGSYSPFIRNVWDRSIPYLLPYFITKNAETHHKSRYQNTFLLSVHFYGDNITQEERETATALVEANGVNFYSTGNTAYFYDSLHAVQEVLK